MGLVCAFLSLIANLIHSMTFYCTPAFFTRKYRPSLNFHFPYASPPAGHQPRDHGCANSTDLHLRLQYSPPPSTRLSRIEISAPPSPSPLGSKNLPPEKDPPNSSPASSSNPGATTLVPFCVSHLDCEGRLNHFWGVAELSSRKSGLGRGVKKQEKLGWEVDPAPPVKLVEIKTRVRLFLVKHARTFPCLT